MTLWKEILVVAVIVVGAAFGGLTAGSYIFMRDPLSWIHHQYANAPCGEGIHVTHNGQPIANLAVKQLGSGIYTWGSTNSTGYLVLSICSPVGVIITFQASDYGFQLEPHLIIEAQL